MATRNTYSIDTYDKLFAKCDGSATTFVDSSTASTKTITASGNAIQLNPKFNKSAGFFNGTTDYVVIPASSTIANFGTGSYTIEGFFNWTTVQNSALFDIGGFADNKGVYLLYQTNKLYLYTNGGARGNVSWTPTANTWYHILVQRNGTTTTQIYVDGTSIATISDNTTIASSSTSDSRLGRTATEPYFAGWIKEFRVSDNARAVAVPTVQYSSDANTKLLMHFDTPATSPLGPAIAFDGTGDYLTVASHADFALTDFTIEAWVKFNSVSGTQDIIHVGDTAATRGAGIQISTGKYYFFISGAGGVSIDSGVLAVQDKWTHIAFLRTGSNLAFYVDGKLAQTSSCGNQLTQESVYIGSSKVPNQYFNGSMREIRVRNDLKYPSAFTPSQTGFTVDANTKLYIKGDENNGVTTFVDSETTPKTVTTNGDCKIKYTEDYRSCIFKDETGKLPYPLGSAKVDFFAIGNGCAYFDGTGDFLSSSNNSDFDFSTGAFSLEAYIRFGTVASDSYYSAIAKYSTTVGWLLRIDPYATSKVVDLVLDSGTNQFTIPTAPAVNTWYHVALTRNGNTLRCFWNGNQIGIDVTTTATWNGAAQDLNIGAYNGGTNAWNGYLDNIRISKGIARYTSAFNPPEFPVGTNSQIIWID